MSKVLLVEDDPVLGRGLQVNLETDGYQVSWAQDLASAREAYAAGKFDLVLLDVGLPDGSGFDFLTHIRQGGSSVPVIFLTAKTDEDSVVEGFERGATDYVKKPFSGRELSVRIKAVLREPLVREEKLRYADLTFLISGRQVLHQEKPIDLNRREFEILLYLVQRADKAVTRGDLVQAIDKESEIYDRTVDSHVSHIRSRLKKAGVTSVQISPVYGIGYRLEKA